MQTNPWENPIGQDFVSDFHQISTCLVFDLVTAATLIKLKYFSFSKEFMSRSYHSARNRFRGTETYARCSETTWIFKLQMF